MGVRIRLLLFALILITSAIAIIYFVNATLFCESSKQINFGLFTVDCDSVPDKGVDANNAYDQACSILKKQYNCKWESLDKVVITYTEFGRQPANYTLTQICRIKNQYSTDIACFQNCGCSYV